jgi:hypothetical protein
LLETELASSVKNGVETGIMVYGQVPLPFHESAEIEHQGLEWEVHIVPSGVNEEWGHG